LGLKTHHEDEYLNILEKLPTDNQYLEDTDPFEKSFSATSLIMMRCHELKDGLKRKMKLKIPRYKEIPPPKPCSQ
jgi:hypothetical protein